MPTIAEIIAAKQAAKNAESAPPAKVQAYADTNGRPPKESIAERMSLKEAIDRIDPPGKHQAATAARKMTGLILNKDMPCKPESRGQATPVKGPEERALATTEGEVIDVTPVDADAETAAWNSALSSLESELCVMRDPRDPEVCWLALKSAGIQRRPLLLHRLPWLLWDHPETPTTEELPF